MIFTVALDKGEPVGPRTHFLGVLPGQCCSGSISSATGSDRGSSRSRGRGRRLRKIPIYSFQQLAAMPQPRRGHRGLVDAWVARTVEGAHRQPHDQARPDELALDPDTPVRLSKKNTTTTAADGVLWVDLCQRQRVVRRHGDAGVHAQNGAVSADAATRGFSRCPTSSATLSVRPKRTAAVVTDPASGQGLDVFHASICECEFIGKKLAERRRVRAAAEQGAAVGGGPRGRRLRRHRHRCSRARAKRPNEFSHPGRAEPVLRRCCAGRARGRDGGAGTSRRDREPDVRGTGRSRSPCASGFRTRVVALRDDWWQARPRPAARPDGDAQTRWRSCRPNAPPTRCVDPKTVADECPYGRSPRSSRLSPTRSTARFPTASSRVGQVVRFGARSIGRDLRWVVMIAIVIGMFGTVDAVPHRAGCSTRRSRRPTPRDAAHLRRRAAVIAAVATGAFKFVQGVATIRMQARMRARFRPRCGIASSTCR